ncbi:Ribosome biogenesis regulatory -like protein [Sarcoptes scabiei]|uniref:Ribosome biogenesis regulatory protein n=1 Tax=Sarcoptes scabiei TaxID=52283 RepID=A0A132A5D5_SARSC|nr:Ribosome biogenesis regulatory -like protein [Sarcoptes scabiei]KPM06168.1 ribosome biogenesis regulatory protein-like protein [Sarcoptes scabiei]
MESIQKILEETIQKQEKAKKSISVEDKQIELRYELAYLTALDANNLCQKSLTSEDKEDYIRNLTRDNVQLIINKIWDLELNKVDNIITAKLPESNHYHLPRSKPIPITKQPTKWETFAKAKGIIKKKKDKKIWDDESKQWMNRFGFKSLVNQKRKNDWMIEVTDKNSDITDFVKRKSEKRRERVAKNEFQRLKNISRSQKIKMVNSLGILPKSVMNKNDLSKAKFLANKSTSSMGKFNSI